MPERRSADHAAAPNADPAINMPCLDVGNDGIIYNSDKIKAIMPNAPLDSLDMVLKKEVASRFAGCGISLLDSWGDILPMVSRYIGQPRLSADKTPLDAVMAKLGEVKPMCGG